MPWPLSTQSRKARPHLRQRPHQVRLRPLRQQRQQHQLLHPRDSNAHGYSDGHSYSYSNAQTDANTQVGAIGKASSHASAETIATFVKANIVAIGDR